MTRYLALLLATVLLSSCAAAPQMQYYRLGASQSRAPTSSNGELQIVLDVQLPDYLNTANIVYQDNDVSVSLAQSNLWAEAPESAIARLLRNDLSASSAQAVWLTNNTANTGNNLLTVSLDQFNGRHDGYAIISGQWLLRDSKQNLIGTYPIKIKIKQQGDGYEPLVRALNQGTHQLAKQIAAELKFESLDKNHSRKRN